MERQTTTSYKESGRGIFLCQYFPLPGKFQDIDPCVLIAEYETRKDNKIKILYLFTLTIMNEKACCTYGSGISSESGLKTFRDSGGLWENYDVMEVASFAGWKKNMELVLQFYNERRAQLKNARAQ